MNDNLILNVDINILLRADISIQQYLFLQLIKNKQKKLLIDYYSVFGKLVAPEDVDKLIHNGYLVAKELNNKGFDNFSISNKFNEITEIKAEDALEDLKRIYPKQTPSGARKGLQTDSNKWGPKYLSIIKKDRALHEKILKSIEAEKQHRKKSNSEEFWSLLLTYVNNKRWEVFIDEIDNLTVEDNVFSKDI